MPATKRAAAGPIAVDTLRSSKRQRKQPIHRAIEDHETALSIVNEAKNAQEAQKKSSIPKPDFSAVLERVADLESRLRTTQDELRATKERCVALEQESVDTRGNEKVWIRGLHREQSSVIQEHGRRLEELETQKISNESWLDKHGERVAKLGQSLQRLQNHVVRGKEKHSWAADEIKELQEESGLTEERLDCLETAARRFTENMSGRFTDLGGVMWRAFVSTWSQCGMQTGAKTQCMDELQEDMRNNKLDQCFRETPSAAALFPLNEWLGEWDNSDGEQTGWTSSSD